MAAMAGILNHHMTAGQALTGKSASPMASSTATTGGAGGTSSSASTSSSSTNSATISANDFLTLLVTEMQNQDPTADVDPNEYINQLVSVNSLEQLIDINQTLTTDSTPATAPTTPATGATPSSLAGSGATAQAHALAHKGSASTAESQHLAASTTTASAAAAHVKSQLTAPGNLSIPETNAAAQRVGNALNGRSSAQSIAGGEFGVQ
jgi:flagellar basal-body rod modification protein FlgD